MFIGQSIFYHTLHQLPFMMLVLLRSSKSISFTLAAFFMGMIYPKKKHVSKLDVLLSFIITAGLIMFNLSVGKLVIVG
jgi:hypothetical protein